MSHAVENKAVGLMKPGHTFTIEPMINVGKCNALIYFHHMVLAILVSGF